jgi:hypothetical protein
VSETETDGRQREKTVLHLNDIVNRLDDAKGHFLVGQREILLSIREVVKLLAELSGEAPESIAGVPVYLLESAAGMIDYIISYLPGPPPEEILKARTEALKELIDLIDKEAERTGRFAAGERDVLKVEALMSLKKFLVHEKEHGPAGPKPRITEVEIE